MLEVRGGRLWLWLLPVLLLGALAPDLAAAAPVPSQTTRAAVPEADTNTVAAERALVGAHLVAFGLTKGAAADRVAPLTDDEVHALAVDPGALQPAGSASTGDLVGGTAVALLMLYGIWLMLSHC